MMRCPKCNAWMTPDMRSCPQCGGDAGPTITRPEPGSSVLERYRSQIGLERQAPSGQSGETPPPPADLGGAIRSPGAEKSTFSPFARAKAEEVQLHAEALGVLNLLLLHGGFSPLKKLEIHTSSDDGLAGFRLRMTASPAVIQPLTLPLVDLRKGGDVRLPVVAPDDERFFRLDEAVRGQLELSLLYEDVPILEESLSVMVHNPNEWIAFEGLESALAGVVTSNAPAVVAMFQTLDSDFVAYQSRDVETLIGEVAEIYEAIRKLGLKYIGVPPSFEGTGQKVLFPDEVISTKMGCCIDIAVLTAALLERAGYNPLIIVIRGHAYSGVWTGDVQAKEPVIRDLSMIKQSIAEGMLLVWNSTTYFDHEGDTSMSAAIKLGTRLLEENFQYAIDIAACRKANFKPLPRRNT